MLYDKSKELLKEPEHPIGCEIIFRILHLVALSDFRLGLFDWGGKMLVFQKLLDCFAEILGLFHQGGVTVLLVKHFFELSLQLEQRIILFQL